MYNYYTKTWLSLIMYAHTIIQSLIAAATITFNKTKHAATKQGQLATI